MWPVLTAHIPHYANETLVLSQSDYRLDGRFNILGVSESGEVRGYLPADTEGATAMMGAKANEKEVCTEEFQGSIS